MNKPLKFLIIDDEQLVRQGLKHTVEWKKYNMEFAGEAANGVAGFELYEKLKPDIVITDIVMPKMDGIQLAEKIREKDSQTRILFLSCHKEFSYAQKGMLLGATGYVLKTNFNNQELESYLSIIQSEVKEARKILQFNDQHMRRSGFDTLECQWNEWIAFRKSEHYDALSVMIEEIWNEKNVSGERWVSFAIYDPQDMLSEDRLVSALSYVRTKLITLLSSALDQFILCCLAADRQHIINALIELKDAIPSLIWRKKEAVHSSQIISDWSSLHRYRQLELKYHISAGHVYADAILQAIEFIEFHLHEELNTAAIAEHVKFSRSHFSTIFKKVTDENISDFIYKIRLERACLLLRTTDWQSSMIAEKIGMRNFKYFSKWFKQNMGMSPTEYRKIESESC